MLIFNSDRTIQRHISHFQHGYTFLAEARTTLSSLASGKFRVRLIGSTEPLPAPDGDSVNAQFVTKEIKEYYMPNKDRVLLRYIEILYMKLLTAVAQER